METTTASYCATRWGISEAAARKILAPLDPVGRDTETGAMLYDPEQADAAHNSRPGRGTRSDRTVRVLPDEDFERLVSDGSIPAAHRALWSLLRDGDARINDVLSLDVRDVDLAAHTADIDYPKHERAPRVVPLSNRTAKLLREVTEGRDTGPLITGSGGRPLGRETAARFARSTAGVSIHAFRPNPHRLDGSEGDA